MSNKPLKRCKAIEDSSSEDEDGQAPLTKVAPRHKQETVLANKNSTSIANAKKIISLTKLSKTFPVLGVKESAPSPTIFSSSTPSGNDPGVEFGVIRGEGNETSDISGISLNSSQSRSFNRANNSAVESPSRPQPLTISNKGK